METDQFGPYVSCFQCGSSVANFEEGTADGYVAEAVEVVNALAKSA